MSNSLLDEIINKVQRSDVLENRLILFKRFLDAELFVLTENIEDPQPKLMDFNQGKILLAFDAEEKLVQFAGDNAIFILTKGRDLLLGNISVGIALNLTELGGGYILTDEILKWLLEHTQGVLGSNFSNLLKFGFPSFANENFLKLIDETVASSPGLASYAVLVENISERNTGQLLLTFVDAVEAFKGILTLQISEAFKMSNVEDVTLDITFAQSNDTFVERALKVGLRFDFPETQKFHEQRPPGMDPKKPPILR